MAPQVAQERSLEIGHRYGLEAVREVWRPNRLAKVEAVYGTMSRERLRVAHLLYQTQPYAVGGRPEGTQLPAHEDFRALRLTTSLLVGGAFNPVPAWGASALYSWLGEPAR